MFKIYKYNIRVVFCSLVSCVALFWYIYTPNIKYIPFSVDKILFVLFLGWTLFNRRWLFLRILSNKQVFIFLLLYIFVFVYTFALDLVVIDGFSTTYHVMQYAAQYIPFSIFLYLYMHSFFGEKTLEQLFKFLLLIVFAQSILGLFMLLDPDLKSFVYGIQSRNAGELYKGLLLRGNGFASGLMFSVPVIHCIVIGAIFFSRNFIPLTIKLLLLVLVVPVAVTNARIALVPLLLISPFILGNAFRLEGFVSMLKSLLVVAVLGFCLFALLPESIASVEQFDMVLKITNWVVGGYASLFGFDLPGNKETIRDILIQDNSYLNLEVIPLLFGMGENAFSALKNQSDIGVINLIRFGGLLYFLLVHFVTYVCIYCSYIRTDSELYRRLLILIGMTYFVISFKGIVFLEQIFSRFMILICVFVILHSIRSRFIQLRPALTHQPFNAGIKKTNTLS
jgi:hypothetical protein